MTLNEIPREGDLKDLPTPTREELISLRNTMETTPGAEGGQEQRKALDNAIRSGSRMEVVRALQLAQTRQEFGQLRERMDAARVSIGNVTDQTIAYGEQVARRLTQPDIAPNWLKFGVITGGATWLLSRVGAYTVGWALGKDARKSIRKWGDRAAIAAGLIAAGTKGVMDVANSRTSTGDAIARQIPLASTILPVGNEVPGADTNERVKRIAGLLNATDWQRPVGNIVVLPAIDTNVFPIQQLEMKQYNGSTLLRSDIITPVGGNEREIVVRPEANRVELHYTVDGVTTTIPPVVKTKPTS